MSTSNHVRRRWSSEGSSTLVAGCFFFEKNWTIIVVSAGVARCSHWVWNSDVWKETRRKKSKIILGVDFCGGGGGVETQKHHWCVGANLIWLWIFAGHCQMFDQTGSGFLKFKNKAPELFIHKIEFKVYDWDRVRTTANWILYVHSVFPTTTEHTRRSES